MRYFLTLLCLLAISFISFKEGAISTKHKNFEADRYSAEYGCLEGGKRACQMISSDRYMYDCFEYIRITYCPAVAKSFEEWLKKNSRK